MSYFHNGTGTFPCSRCGVKGDALIICEGKLSHGWVNLKYTDTPHAFIDAVWLTLHLSLFIFGLSFLMDKTILWSTCIKNAKKFQFQLLYLWIVKCVCLWMEILLFRYCSLPKSRCEGCRTKNTKPKKQKIEYNFFHSKLSHNIEVVLILSD